MARPTKSNPTLPAPSKIDPGAPPASADWKHLHLWQMQPVRDVLVLAAVFGVLYLGYVLSIVTVPLLLALALAYLFEPLVKWATRSGRFSRGGVALAVIGLAAVLVVVPVILGVGFATVQGARYAQRLATNIHALTSSVTEPDDATLREQLPNESWKKIRDAMVHELTPHTEAPAPGADVAGDHPVRSLSDTGATLQWAIGWLQRNSETIGKQALETGAGAIEALVRGATALGMGVFGMLLTAFFFYFFCTGYGTVLTFWRGLIPERRKGRVLDLLDKMDRVIAGFIRGRLIICAIMCVFFSVAFFAIGTPASLVLGVIVGVLVIVPYVSAVGVPIAIVLMWLDPPGGVRGEWWWIVFAPVVVYSIGQAVLDYVLTPLIQGKSMHMDMATILFVSLAGGVLAGFYGLLLAIPAGACIKILLNEVFWPRFRKWAEGRARDFLPIEPG